MEDRRATIIEIIARQICREESEITDNSDLRVDLEADSLDVVEIQMDLAEAGIDISDDRASKWKTVADVIADAEAAG